MDLMGPGSLLLYFAGVLTLMSVSVWHYIKVKPHNRGEPGHKADYVVMTGGSQAVLQMDPRSPEAEPAATDKTA